jgi:hypothetical protein
VHSDMLDVHISCNSSSPFYLMKYYQVARIACTTSKLEANRVLLPMQVLEHDVRILLCSRDCS